MHHTTDIKQQYYSTHVYITPEMQQTSTAIYQQYYKSAPQHTIIKKKSACTTHNQYHTEIHRICNAIQCLFVGCLTCQQHPSVSQGRICSDNFMCCYTEIEVADQTFYLTQSQYTDTGPTSPSADPITPGSW